jgi:hypothetical protein
LRYIFWIRRASSLDHIAPVIYSLVKYSNIKVNNIIVSELYPSLSLKAIDKDKRLLFLKSLGVSIKCPKRKGIRYLFLFSIKPSNSIFLKLIRRILRLMISPVINNTYKKQIIKVANKYKNNCLFITDQGSNDIYQYLTRTAQNNNIKSVALPHGLVLHQGNKNPIEHVINFPVKKHFDHFDHIIMPNKISNSFCNISKNKLEILGSARFCKEWVEQLCKIYPSPKELRNENKLTVLLLAEKHGPKEAPWIYKKHIKKIVEYLNEHPSINLIIKYHPSMSKNDTYSAQNATGIYSDEDYTTFQLTRVSDLIIATASSALLDVFVLGKDIMVPKFASPFKLIFDDYNNVVVEDFEILKHKIEKIVLNGIKISPQINVEKLYNDIVCGDNENVLKSYSDYFNSFN